MEWKGIILVSVGGAVRSKDLISLPNRLGEICGCAKTALLSLNERRAKTGCSRVGFHCS